MIVLSCAVQACQYVYEEKLMDDSCQPMVVVGMEGVWGLLLTTFIVYPLAYLIPGTDQGSNELFSSALTLLSNSTSAQSITLVYLAAVLGYNVFAVLVTYLLNSIWHAILDNFRPISVWGVDLLLFYVVTQHSFGEAWTPWSWIQLAGMGGLLIGTAVYNGSLRLPGCDYPTPMEPDSLMRTPLNLASITLGHSPLISRKAVQLAQAAAATPSASDRAELRRLYITDVHSTFNTTNPTRHLDPSHRLRRSVSSKGDEVFYGSVASTSV